MHLNCQKKTHRVGRKKNRKQKKSNQPNKHHTHNTKKKPSTTHTENTECVSSCGGKVTWITWGNHILSATGIRSAAFPALEKLLREYAWKRLQYHWNLHSPNLQMPEAVFFLTSTTQKYCWSSPKKGDSIIWDPVHLLCLCTLQLSNSLLQTNSAGTVTATVWVRVAKSRVNRRKYINGLSERKKLHMLC